MNFKKGDYVMLKSRYYAGHRGPYIVKSVFQFGDENFQQLNIVSLHEEEPIKIAIEGTKAIKMKKSEVALIKLRK